MNYFQVRSKIIVEKNKVIHYLLNPSHPEGGSKAKLLIRLGFHPENWEDFAESVIDSSQHSELISETDTLFGKKIALKGWLETPGCKLLLIKSIWIVSSKSPTLVTLFPTKK